MTESFAADWLALREPFDHAARSKALARRLVERLPKRPRLVDLGAGTGSMFRFLAPIIGRGQDWVLVDADAALLDEAFGRTAAWARHQGFAATAAGDELLLSTPRGLWRMRGMQRGLTAPSSWPGLARPSTSSFPPSSEDVDGRVKPGHDDGPRFEADAVVCSALLDLVSATWLIQLCDTLTVPLLACLTVDGRDSWRPHHPLDILVRAAFRRDMQRNKGFGPALGTNAPRVLATRGLMTASAPSDWRIPRSALRMQRALIDGIADAARTAHPAHAIAITTWQEARLRQALRGRLAITIGHRDILALPPGG
ncbi:MAG TPA: class I SAM-dependent methyltransferase [Acetobacteraceae bacterium]